MRKFLMLALLAAAFGAAAEAPRQVVQSYAAEAARQQPGFTPSAARGGEFFKHRFGINDKMPACVACHTEQPTQAGRHAVTGKAIRPLAPAADADRLSDAGKVEKWFGRNCKEVVGRACTPAEKADFLQFLVEAR